MSSFFKLVAACFEAVDRDFLAAGGEYMSFGTVLRQVQQKLARALKNPRVSTHSELRRALGLRPFEARSHSIYYSKQEQRAQVPLANTMKR